MCMSEYLIWALQLAGVAQLVLVVGSVAIPKCLNWSGGLACLMPLLRQMFWTYAIYISMMHVFFGIVSLFAAGELVSGGFITTSMCVLMFVWWFARILIQFFYFDKTGLPVTRLNQCAEVALVLLFAFLSLVYGWTVWENMR